MARVRELAGLPIEQHNSPNRGGAMDGHRGVVLHIAQGTYRGTISWQLNPDQRYADGTRVNTCSTWIVGKDRGEWAQMVDTSEIAWAHRGGSRTWLSIELEGFAPAAPTAWQVEACAQLLAWSAATYGHPIARADHEGERGLGHHSMDREQVGVEWGHEQCPGSGVIGAKNAIVTRARQIAEGDDGMAGITKEEFLELYQYAAERVEYDLTDGEGHRWWAGEVMGRDKMNGKQAAMWGLGVAVHRQAMPELARIRGELAGLAAAVAGQDAAEAARAAIREEFAKLGPALAEQLADVPAERIEAALRAVLRTGVDES